ncbi:MAG TPA: ATP-binding protein [Beijerinckiaceae bacterium]|nr:ATP-binding protein [Beijerinckiaceae bacterium]
MSADMVMALVNPFRVDTASTPLMRAQLAAFTKQVPLLYFILSVNAAVLAFAFADAAPRWLSIGVPAGLISVCAIRFVTWVRSRGRQLSDAAVRKRLQATVILGAVIGVLFLSWALALFPYGSERGQDHVTFFVAITVISCIFCLMHLRPAALLLTCVIVIPFVLFLLSTGDASLVSIAINLGLVSVAMVYVLVVASRDFAELVRSQLEARSLAEKLETKVRERTHALELALDAAQEASRAKSLFLASMSHELRTPLNAVIGYSEILLEDAQLEGCAGQLTDLEKINAAGKHLLGLINDVLDLSKIEAGSLQIDRVTIDLAPFLREIVDSCGPLAARNGNTVEIEVARDATTIAADPTRLRQSLISILSNACKFTQQGSIRVSADRDEQWLRLAVRDSGIGIAPDHLAKLFTNFTQANSEIGAKYGGTGLGLALSQKLCQLMGGRIVAESRVGEGSCFTIHLPLEPPLDTRLAA